MRSSARLLASVAKYLEPNTPTGLTGLTTHPAPRPALIYTYRRTLEKLKQLPGSSVYRQSTENLTNHRLKLIEEVVPEGFEAWKERVWKQIEASPAAYGKLKREDGSFAYGEYRPQLPVAWDGTVSKKSAYNETSNGLADAEKKVRAAGVDQARIDKVAKEGVLPTVDDLEPEPPLTAEQIEAIEVKIGAGLIEEVVAVAEAELELVGEMLKSQAWEPLEEQIPPGQWVYFERGDRV